MKRVIEADAAMTEDLVSYNIIPLDAPSTTNAIAFLAEVNQFFCCFIYLCLVMMVLIYRRNTGPCSSFSIEVLQGSAEIAIEFFYTSYKEYRHV